TDIELSASTPPGWDVTFDEDTVQTLKASEKAKVQATISAQDDAIAGDYVTTFAAKTAEASSEASIRDSVKTSTWWGLVGDAIILAVIGGLYYIYKTYGRREIMDDAIIQLQDLTKLYDDRPTVDRLSLSIKKGEIFGLLGPNGAGKSMTILMLLGLSEPTGGKVHVCGLDSTTQPLEVKKRVGYLPDDLGFYQHMTGLENLLYTAAINGISRKEAEKRAYDLLNQVGLQDAADKKAGKYSRGMKQRLGLADVLIKNPEVIILDEPTLGIDPEG